MKPYALMLLIALFAVSGCRSFPAPTHHAYTTQQELLSAYHWDVLAEHIAVQLRQTLDLTFVDGAIRPAVFLRHTVDSEKIPFLNGLHSQLRTRLLQQGINVVTDTQYADTLIMDVKAQVVEHASPYSEVRRGGRVCFNCAPSRVPYGEVIVSTAVTMGPQYIFSSEDVFYTRAIDFDFYEQPGKVYQVVNQ
ncbi:hypothetical protein [Thioflexithrix psekupsensis]|uniref:FlgO domain-containing protein n=1 Tax=Thioflexithrix psekupsensis TaxID=1570016 RepID=A0A251X547_9GAMM|nr:hypothetical protein [Thioflexithrix psekupsensis]OUD12329.1 hypothetical protein TPSD3_14545 [Thioflexithrix psekupsensis]